MKFFVLGIRGSLRNMRKYQRYSYFTVAPSGDVKVRIPDRMSDSKSDEQLRKRIKKPQWIKPPVLAILSPP